MALVKFTLADFFASKLLILPVNPVRFRIEPSDTVMLVFVAVLPILAVRVALSTTTFVYDVLPQSKLATSVQFNHLATLPLLSVNSYTKAASISYSHNQDVLSYVVFTLASCESSVVEVANKVTVVPATSLPCT